MKTNKLKSVFLLASVSLAGLLASCGQNEDTKSSERGKESSSSAQASSSVEEEIALGSSVIGNWKFRTADGKSRTSDNKEIEVYVDAETKFHFTITKYYTDFAPSVFTYEGQITGIEKGVGSCFAVFANSYLSHGAVTESSTSAAKTQFAAYKATLPDMYEGNNQFEITFHRLSNDTYNNGYITVDNKEMDVSMGVFDAVDNAVSAAASTGEIALGSSVLGNWSYQTKDGKELTSDHVAVKVYVDAETKFHFTIQKYYTDFAPSLFTYEGQITGIEKGVGSCFAVFVNAYLSHGAVAETATTAAKEQFTTYKGTFPDKYEGNNQFEITFHRLANDTYNNGYITVDNAEMDVSMAVFGAVDA